MDLFRNRPFALSVSLAAGIAFLASTVLFSGRWIIALLLLVAAGILLVIGLFRRRCGAVQSTAILACLLSGLLLFSSWGFFEGQIGILQQASGNEVYAEGIITEQLSASSNQSRVALDLKEIDGKRVDQRVILNCEYFSTLREGERVRVIGTVKAFRNLQEDDSFTGWIADGFSGMLTCTQSQDCVLLNSGEKTLFTRLSEWNIALSERLAKNIGGEEGGLAAALILGNRSFLSAQDVLAFRRVGISHFLALSGLHVGILIAAIERLLYLLRMPRKGRMIAIVVLSLFYVVLTGASPSTIRAVFMAAMLVFAFLLQRAYDSPTSIFTALFVILLVQPYSVVDVGLWLSFFAAGGIVIFVPAMRDLLSNGKKIPQKAIHPIKRAAKALFLATAVGAFAFCATLPISAMVFGEVSILSVPATLLLAPLLSVVLVLSALCLLLPVQPVFFLEQKVLWLLRFAARSASEWRGITVRLQNRVTLIFLTIMVLALIICAVWRFRHKWLSVIPALLAGAVLISAYVAIPLSSQAVQVDYFSQKGNEYLLFSRGGKACAVDCSIGNKNYTQSLIQTLHVAGCTELEELAFTHYHTSSMDLLDRLASKIKIRTVLLPTPQNQDEQAVCVRMEEKATRLKIACVMTDESRTIDGLKLQWMHDEGLSEPAITIVARIQKSVLVWCNAKATSEQQTAFFQQYAAVATTFIFGQHGASSGQWRSIPELRASRVLTGEWKSSAIPFLPQEQTFYQTVSGQTTFSLE